MKTACLNVRITIIALFFVAPLFCMKQEKVLVPIVNRVGLFNELPPELRKPVFGQLCPADINALRRSCGLFSEVFSFCRPTLEFISYANNNLHPKDLKAILFAAVYDKKDLLVQTLWGSYRDYYKKDKRYEIDGVFSGLFLCIEEVENNYLDLSILSVSKRKTLKDHIYPYRCKKPNELLIACISRDSQRVLRVLKSGNFDLKPAQEKIDSYTLELPPRKYILRSLGFSATPTSKLEIGDTYKYLQNPQAMYVVIDNGDELTMRLMLEDKRFLGHIGRGGHGLVQRAIFKKREKISELLIASKYCDFNEKGPDYIQDWLTKEDNKKEKLYSLLEILDNHYCPIACWKYFEHIKNLLTENSFCVID